MIRVCCICWREYGEKPPLDDPTPTYGCCDDCYDDEGQRIRREAIEDNRRRGVHA